MRARALRAVPRTAANVAAAPVRSADPEKASSRSHAVLASLRPTSRRALTGAAATAVAVVLASTAAAGSYALLNARATSTLGTVTLTAGTLGITVNGSSSASAVQLPAGFAKLLPGDYYSQPIAIANSGNTPGIVRVRLAAATAPYEARISTTTCTAGYSTTASGTVLGTADTVLGTLAGGAATNGCLQIGLASTAPAASTGTSSVTAATASASFALTFTATQPS